jgi:hypothetical protein
MIVDILKQWITFVCKFVPREVSQANRHLFILDGHGSHVTIQVGLNMVTLLAHTSHAL